MVSDTGVVNPGNVWGGGYINDIIYRDAFFGGYSSEGLMLEFNPIEMLAINIGVPFIAQAGEAKGVYQHTTAQVDLNLDFGNIALTYVGDTNEMGNPSKLFAYFGLSAIDNLGLDVGAGIQFKNEDDTKNPIFVGLGLKVGITDAFGIKFRTVANFGGEEHTPVGITADVLPYFAVSDTLRIFLNAGIALNLYDSDTKLANGDDASATVGFNINPYVEVGAEWGPTFYAGVKLWSGGKDLNTQSAKGDAVVNWEVPIAIGVSF